MSHPIEEHARYLADPNRLEAYRAALALRVKPGAAVLDLGSGSGILGLLSCQAGAARVYCVDDGPLMPVARSIARASGFEDRLSFLPGHSTEVELPEKVDLVVADQMSPFGVGAGLIESFRDARARLLEPGGALVPERLLLCLCLGEYPEFRRQMAAMRAAAKDIDVSAFAHAALHDPRWVARSAVRLVAEPGSFCCLELGLEQPEQLDGALDLVATGNGAADGLIGWFSATLAEGIELTNSPVSAAPIQRELLFLPFLEPVGLSAGERLRVTLSVRRRRVFYAWHVQRYDSSGKLVTLCRQTSLPSALLDRAQLMNTDPAKRPGLNWRGRARRQVLTLADGSLTLAEIVDRTFAEHASKLRTRERATEFVVDALRGNLE